MRIIVDLNEHEAVNGFGTRTPPAPFEFKSQDTIDFQIYFVADGIVQDMGVGFALKFGMIKTGDATNTILAYQTTSSRLTDPSGNVYYQMQVLFNTSQMATAIGTSASINCTIELRYQSSIGEIIHTLNIPAIVFSTVLVETGVTPPGVSTGYPDASTIELLVHKDQPSGYAGLDSSGKILTSELTGTVEMVANKNQPSGYAGLDSSTLVPVAEIPIDNSTIVVTGGKISAPFVGGDMRKSQYDLNNDGVCDHAALADNATTATHATDAGALSTTATSAAISTVWGRDAAGNQNLFAATSLSTGQLFPEQGIEWSEHFDGSSYSSKGWSNSVSGGVITFPGTFGIDATNKVLGGIDFAAGTGAPTRAQIWYGAAVPQNYQPGLGVCTIEIRLALQSLQTPSSDTATMQWGIAQGYQSSGGDQGFYFSYDGNALSGTPTNWILWGAPMTSGATFLDPGVAATIGFHHFKIVTAANWLSATFYLDGTSLGTITLTGTYTEKCQPFVYVKKGGGTTSFKLTVDWIHFKYACVT